MDLTSMQWVLGPFILTPAGLAFSVAILSALLLTYREARRRLLPRQETIDFMLLALIGGLSGGRLIHAFAMDQAYYLGNPLRLLYFNEGGFSFLGGVLTAVLMVTVWSSGKKIILERYLDAAAPALALALIIGWIACPPQGKTMLGPYPWGIKSGLEVIHPDGVYAIVMLTIGLTLIWRRRWHACYEGELFFWFGGWYALTVAVVGHFRVVVPLWRGFSLEQILAAPVLLAVVLYILFGVKKYISPWRPYGRYFKPPTRDSRLFRNLLPGIAITLLAAFYYYLHG